VGYDDQGKFIVLLQILEQVDDLSLDGKIES